MANIRLTRHPVCSKNSASIRNTCSLIVAAVVALSPLTCSANDNLTNREVAARQFVQQFYGIISVNSPRVFGQLFRPSSAVQFIDPEKNIQSCTVQQLLSNPRLDGFKRHLQATKKIVSVTIREEQQLVRAIVAWQMGEGVKTVRGEHYFTLIDTRGNWRVVNLIHKALPQPLPIPNEDMSARDKMLEQMAAVIKPSIERHDTKRSIFHGCYDWHSAVHGHWALLRIANVAADQKPLGQLVAQRLNPELIQQEAVYLKQKPKFEMPYGRAWFLRLVIEYELWSQANAPQKAKHLTAMGDEVATSLQNYYLNVQSPTPESREYNNASWAILHLHDYHKHRNNAEGLQTVSAIIQNQFVNQQWNLSFALDFERPDFFSPFGNHAYLIAKTQDNANIARFLDQHPIAEAHLRPADPLLPNAHHLGINWSRAWALKALSRCATNESQREQFEKAYQAHVSMGMKHHQQNVGNFGRYDHWVPQFAVFAITE